MIEAVAVVVLSVTYVAVVVVAVEACSGSDSNNCGDRIGKSPTL